MRSQAKPGQAPEYELRRLENNDIRCAARVLSAAFQRDPIWTELLRNEHSDCSHAAFEAPLRYCLRYGEVRGISPSIEGVAAWVPGDKADITLWRALRSGTALAGMRMGLRLVRRIESVFRAVQVERRANMKGESYVYLMVLGVAPESQGRGLGGRLLRALIAESERQEVSIYLETETQSNVGLYEHLGFRLIRQTLLPVVELPMWEMVRSPATQGA